MEVTDEATVLARPQTPIESLKEILLGTWTGMVGSLLITLFINWMFIGLVPIWVVSLLTVAACTVWSILRGFYIRRWYNRRQVVKS